VAPLTASSRKSHQLVNNIKNRLVETFHRRATLQYYYINNEKNPPEDIYYGLKEGEYNCIESIIDIDRCGWNVKFDILVLECCPIQLFASPRAPFSHIPSDFQLFLENLPPLSDNCILATPNYADYQLSVVAVANIRNITNNFLNTLAKIPPMRPAWVWKWTFTNGSTNSSTREEAKIGNLSPVVYMKL